MPADAQPPSQVPPKESTPKANGLAGVDLLTDTHAASRTSNTGRFEEYKVEGEDEKFHADIPAVSEGIEVVKIKRKKKKDGEKKRREIE
jgi:hypothetical protein